MAPRKSSTTSTAKSKAAEEKAPEEKSETSQLADAAPLDPPADDDADAPAEKDEPKTEAKAAEKPATPTAEQAPADEATKTSDGEPEQVSGDEDDEPAIGALGFADADPIGSPVDDPHSEVGDLDILRAQGAFENKAPRAAELDPPADKTDDGKTKEDNPALADAAAERATARKANITIVGELGEEDLDSEALFGPQNQDGRVIVLRTLLQRQQIPPYDRVVTTLLVAKGQRLTPGNADAIKAKVADEQA